MRADNHGEGGILALTSLATPKGNADLSAALGPDPLGLFGTALLYGDGIITPAISVLSAVEGLEVAHPASATCVVPITVRDPRSGCSRSSAGTGDRRQALRPGDGRLVRRPRRARRRATSSTHPGCSRPSTRSTPSTSSSTTACTASWSSARSSWSSPAARRSTPTWATSAGGRSASAGSPWSCPPCCSTTSARARCSCASPRRVENPFYELAPDWCVLPLIALATAGHGHRLAGPHLGRLLADHAGHPARLHARASRSTTPPRTRWARSTCRPSTGP